MSEQAPFADLVEKGPLIFMVPRRDVRKWANYVDREVALRTGATRVSVTREHLISLDSKSGTMAGISSVLLAVCAVTGNYMYGGSYEPGAQTNILFALTAIASALSAVYVMSSLGVEMPEDAGAKGDAAFEFRLLQRLVYRARNHAWGLRFAQVGGALSFFLAGALVPGLGLGV
ncbi:MAG: hypothetical protein SGJ23_02090 [Alphaproteobacteria bacterium]|nr:hypothetical protein [Alphaproteobacteria bacterium]